MHAAFFESYNVGFRFGQDSLVCGTLPEGLKKKLIQAGVKLDASDRDGFTPLMLAITGGNLKIATYFIEQGADVNRRNRRGQTALMLAAQDGRK